MRLPSFSETYRALGDTHLERAGSIVALGWLGLVGYAVAHHKGSNSLQIDYPTATDIEQLPDKDQELPPSHPSQEQQ